MIEKFNLLFFSALLVLTALGLSYPKLASAYTASRKASRAVALNNGYDIWHCGQKASAHVCLIYNSKTNLMYAKGAWLSGNNDYISIRVTIFDDSAPWFYSPQDITDTFCDDNGNSLCRNFWLWVPRVHIYKHNHRYHAEIVANGYKSSVSGYTIIASTPSITIK